MSTLERCVRELLIAGTDDWVYLAEAVRIVESISGTSSVVKTRQLTLDMIRDVVQRKLMDIGDLLGQGGCFRKWNMSMQECLDRIEREWNTLGRNPTLGEICWLQNTDKGDELGGQFLK